MMNEKLSTLYSCSILNTDFGLAMCNGEAARPKTETFRRGPNE